MKRRAADIAYDRIRGHLLAGRWPAGTHLREAELSAELGMSRTPVRAALQRLAADSLIGFAPHLGATVPGWTADDLDEIFALRLALEGMAAERAATRATADQIAALDGLARAMAEAAAARGARLGRITEVNQRFHRLIVEASGSRRLLRLIELVTELPVVVGTFVRYDDRAMARSIAHHGELVEAIRARDGTWARAVMEAHLRAGRDVMVPRPAAGDTAATR
ncbi:FCD domain-containing protein [Rhodoplanes serenus]|uniref:FCD domain-containing protein n=1 Tax=Rhodoplanes serenus TaxID=200615 RepID=A0A9X4XLN5_9BRAD|nr:GntR family transcriptional regulator [Rhodoplanes serenus]MTW16431.1 FCD domain-containing protein [Rhodoplanes serenus]